ncbi:MAG: hypothetical protein K0U12_01150 [Gammaproteobacteria bacterium]|nr:hypothetical protein [Gammaproteobacteria bacterium]
MTDKVKISKETAEQVGKALQAIHEEVKDDPEARKLFEENPGAMLQKHGVDTRKLPTQVLEDIAGGIISPNNNPFGGGNGLFGGNNNGGGGGNRYVIF